MDTVTAPPHVPSSNLDRAEACQTVTDHLRWIGLTDPDRLEALAGRFLDDAEATGRPATELVRAAAADWYAAVLGPTLTRPELAVMIGRAALLIAGGPQRWGGHVLADPPPAELVAALRRAVPVPAPEPMPAAMVAQPIEVPSLLPALRRVSRSRTTAS